MRLDLSNMIIDLRVENAYSKGGIPLNVTGVWRTSRSPETNLAFIMLLNA